MKTTITSPKTGREISVDGPAYNREINFSKEKYKKLGASPKWAGQLKQMPIHVMPKKPVSSRG